MLKNVLTIIQLVISIVMTVVILMQSGKDAGLGAIAGNNESYMGKSGSSADKKLSTATKVIAVIWVLMTLALCLLP